MNIRSQLSSLCDTINDRRSKLKSALEKNLENQRLCCADKEEDAINRLTAEAGAIREENRQLTQVANKWKDAKAAALADDDETATKLYKEAIAMMPPKYNEAAASKPKPVPPAPKPAPPVKDKTEVNSTGSGEKAPKPEPAPDDKTKVSAPAPPAKKPAEEVSEEKPAGSKPAGSPSTSPDAIIACIREETGKIHGKVEKIEKNTLPDGWREALDALNYTADDFVKALQGGRTTAKAIEFVQSKRGNPFKRKNKAQSEPSQTNEAAEADASN